MQKRHVSLLVGSWIIATLLSGSLFAEEDKKEDSDQIGKYRVEGIDVVQGRVFRKGLRHEFTIGGGIIPNNTYLRYELAELRYTFHFRETLAFEGTYAYAFNQEKSIIKDLDGIPCPSGASAFFDANGNVVTTGCGVQLENPPDPLKHAAFGNLVWSPLYGKFSIFSKKIFHFDFYFLAGAGVFINEDSKEFAFNVGGGWKVFINDWSAVRFDFRNVTVREGAPFNQIVNNHVFSLGMSFFLPPHPQPLWDKDVR